MSVYVAVQLCILMFTLRSWIEDVFLWYNILFYLQIVLVILYTLYEFVQKEYFLVRHLGTNEQMASFLVHST
jgi:hypothetical protein